MQEVKTTLIKTEKTTLLLVLGCLVVSIILGWHFFSWGLLIGALLSLVNFRLLVKSAVSFTDLENKKNPFVGFFLSYFGRLILIGIVFFLCLLRDKEVFLGAAVGFLLVYFSIFINGLFVDKT